MRKCANAFVTTHYVSNYASSLVSMTTLEYISLRFPSSYCTTESPYHMCSRYAHGIFVKAVCLVQGFREENKQGGVKLRNPENYRR